MGTKCFIVSLSLSAPIFGFIMGNFLLAWLPYFHVGHQTECASLQEIGGSHLINSGLLGLPLSLEMNSITYFKQRLRISCHFKSEIWKNYPPAALNSVGAVKHQYYFSISAQRAYARACAQPGRSKGKRASGPERYTRVKVHREPRFDPWHHYSSLSLPQTNEEPRVSSEDSHFSPKLTNQIKHLSLTSRVGIPSA